MKREIVGSNFHLEETFPLLVVTFQRRVATLTPLVATGGLNVATAIVEVVPGPPP